jgi:cephalosporin hydroxylase
VGSIFKSTEKYIDAEPGSIILEIGSDRYEGSTDYFAKLAQAKGIDFHTVDISDDAKRRLPFTVATWHIAKGSEWCQHQLQRRVCAVYLDNHDYVYAGADSNEECQVEHFKQMIHILPWLTDNAVVVMDDTYTWNGCWVGKCGPIVAYLLSIGFEFQEVERSIKDCGIILKRTKKQ